MPNIREPAVAGMFYPDDPATLRRMIDDFLSEATTNNAPPPKAIIAPHAGYIYSGPVAASAYARLRTIRHKITRVVLLGPSHRVAFAGLAASSATFFRTPLGDIPLDTSVIDTLDDLPQLHLLDQAHLQEHSLEVHLPFLQMSLDHFQLIPLVVGDATAEEVAEVLERLWGGEETLIVISSDLSHYHDYATAQHLDSKTATAIEEFKAEGISSDGACGRNPVKGLLLLARRKGMRVETLDLRNSGDTAGPRDQVVGYGAWAFSQNG
jgi:hypothetical protein